MEMQSQGGQGFLPVWITFGPINKCTFKEHEMNLASFGSGKRWLNWLNSDLGMEERMTEEQWPFVKKAWLQKYGEKLEESPRRSCNSCTTVCYKRCCKRQETPKRD